MNRLFLIFIAFTSILFTQVNLFETNSLVSSNEQNSLTQSLFPTTTEKAILSPAQIKKKARAITVKVIAGDTWGSGIIIHQLNDIYTVVTNNHVLIFSQDTSYQIQTPDGQIHQGNILKQVDFGNNDLALVQFQSNQKYSAVSLAPVNNLNREEEVFAAGFPIEIEDREDVKDFYFTNGYIAQFTQLDFGGGYQIGYTNDIKKGMSGGPLLNARGQVVAINGIHKHPLWGNPYKFSDGSLASEAKKQEMSQLSWAIPINTFLRIAPLFSPSNN